MHATKQINVVLLLILISVKSVNVNFCIETTFNTKACCEFDIDPWFEKQNVEENEADIHIDMNKIEGINNDLLSNKFIIYITGGYKTGKTSITSEVLKNKKIQGSPSTNTKGLDIWFHKFGLLNTMVVDTEGLYQPINDVSVNKLRETLLDNIYHVANVVIVVVGNILEHEKDLIDELISGMDPSSKLLVIHNLRDIKTTENLSKAFTKISELFSLKSNKPGIAFKEKETFEPFVIHYLLINSLNNEYNKDVIKEIVSEFKGTPAKVNFMDELIKSKDRVSKIMDGKIDEALLRERIKGKFVHSKEICEDSVFSVVLPDITGKPSIKYLTAKSIEINYELKSVKQRKARSFYSSRQFATGIKPKIISKNAGYYKIAFKSNECSVDTEVEDIEEDKEDKDDL